MFCFSDRDTALLSLDGGARLLSDCLEVLQKPSEAKMRERGMVVTSAKGEEAVYTDSAYWVSAELARRIAEFGRREREAAAAVETSIYSDFMTCQVGGNNC